MYFSRINPRTGEVMYVGMDGVPAPDQQAAQRAVQQACLMAEAAAPRECWQQETRLYTSVVRLWTRTENNT